LTCCWIIFGTTLSTLKHSGGIAAIQRRLCHHRRTAHFSDHHCLVVRLLLSKVHQASRHPPALQLPAPLLVTVGFPAMAAVLMGMLVQKHRCRWCGGYAPIIVWD
jgi:hypothetical protein